MADDPSRIDVDLNLIDSETIAAFRQEMTALGSMMRQMNMTPDGAPLNRSGSGGASTAQQMPSRYTTRSEVSSQGPAAGSEGLIMPPGVPDPRTTQTGATAQAQNRLGRFGAGIRNWASTPANQPTTDELGYATPGTGGPSGGASAPTGGSWWQQRLGQGALDNPVTMPRFGEFTAQDTLDMLSNRLGTAGMKYAGSSNAFVRGGASVAGSMAGAFDIMQEYSPYAARATQHLSGLAGMPLASPMAMGEVGQSMGYSGGTNIGPLQLSSGILPAYSRAASNIWQGMTTPGISGTEFAEMEDALDASGMLETGPYSGNRQAIMEMWGGLKGDENGPPMPSIETIADMSMQALRWSSDTNPVASVEDLEDSIRRMGDTAISSGRNVDEFAQASMALADELQNRGLTYQQGLTAAVNFTSSTGLQPELAQPLMDDPMMQMNLMGSTGLLPEQQGLAFAETGQFNSDLIKTIGQYRNMYSGVNVDTTLRGPKGAGWSNEITGDEADMAMIASQMGLPVEVVSDMWDRRGEIKAEGAIQSGLENWNESRKDIMQKTNGEGPRYERMMANLHSGKGKYSGSDASMREVVDQLHEYDRSGKLAISDDQWERIDSAGTDKDRMRAIQKVTAEARKDRETPDVSVKFTGLAKKFFEQVNGTEMDNARRANRRGEAPINGQATKPTPRDTSGLLSDAANTVTTPFTAAADLGSSMNPFD